MSTSCTPTNSSDRITRLQGTLDLLILRTLLFGPAHGHQITKHIEHARMTCCKSSMARSILLFIAWNEKAGWP
jgi:hypothetical protein